MQNNLELRFNGVNGTNGSFAAGAAPGRRFLEVSQTVNKRKPLDNRAINMATWNVRSMTLISSLEQVQREAERLRIDIIGIAETHWKENGKVTSSDSWEILYLGGNSRYAGIGFLVTARVKAANTEIRPIDERVMFMIVDDKPRPINILQV